MANGHADINAETLNEKGCEYGRKTNTRLSVLEKEMDKMYNWIKLGITSIIAMFFAIIILLLQILWG